MKMLKRTSLLILAIAAAVSAQPVARHATNLAAVLAYPGYYHGRPILLIGTVEVANGQLQVSDEAGAMRLLVTGRAPDGLDEIRGELWDLGRMKPDDPRLNSYDLRATFQLDPDSPWPRQGEVMAIVATAIAPATMPAMPSIRSIVLNPSRYLDAETTITGQFSGRNLFGDLPDAPAKSRYDFVLRAADGAIWVTNMRPKLKDANGKDIELRLDARLDTGRWLSVRGTVRQGRGLLWIDAEAGSLALAEPTKDTVAAEEAIQVPAGPPPDVIFSVPTQEEADVLQATNVRIQFSRDLDQSTLKGRIRVAYSGAETAGRGAPVIGFTHQYSAASSVLELRFAEPLERFRTVKVELLDGIAGTDGQALKPWTLTFSVGGT